MINLTFEDKHRNLLSGGESHIFFAVKILDNTRAFVVNSEHKVVDLHEGNPNEVTGMRRITSFDGRKWKYCNTYGESLYCFDGYDIQIFPGDSTIKVKQTLNNVVFLGISEGYYCYTEYKEGNYLTFVKSLSDRTYIKEYSSEEPTPLCSSYLRHNNQNWIINTLTDKLKCANLDTKQTIIQDSLMYNDENYTYTHLVSSSKFIVATTKKKTAVVNLVPILEGKEPEISVLFESSKGNKHIDVVSIADNKIYVSSLGKVGTHPVKYLSEFEVQQL